MDHSSDPGKELAIAERLLTKAIARLRDNRLIERGEELDKWMPELERWSKEARPAKLMTRQELLEDMRAFLNNGIGHRRIRRR